MLTPLQSHYTLLHVSALKEPSLGSTDTFYEQGQQNTHTDVNIGLKKACFMILGSLICTWTGIMLILFTKCISIPWV